MYYEVRMSNGDTFKAKKPPVDWHEERIVEEIPGHKCGNYLGTLVSFVELRVDKPVFINFDQISSVRVVEDANDRTVNMIADEEFVEDTMNVASKILDSIFNGGRSKNEVITIDNPKTEE